MFVPLWGRPSLRTPSEVLASPLLHVTLELDYAIRILSVLATSSGDERFTAAAVARAADISEAMSRNVLGRLHRSALLRRTRGNAAGWQLTSDPESISLASIVELVQGQWMPSPPEANRVYRSSVWHDLEQEMRARLERITLADLIAASSVPTA